MSNLGHKGNLRRILISDLHPCIRIYLYVHEYFTWAHYNLRRISRPALKRLILIPTWTDWGEIVFHFPKYCVMEVCVCVTLSRIQIVSLVSAAAFAWSNVIYYSYMLCYSVTREYVSISPWNMCFFLRTYPYMHMRVAMQCTLMTIVTLSLKKWCADVVDVMFIPFKYFAPCFRHCTIHIRKTECFRTIHTSLKCMLYVKCTENLVIFRDCMKQLLLKFEWVSG